MVLAMAGPAAFAQTSRGGPRKSPILAWTEHDCRQGVKLRLSSSQPRQGSLQLIEIRSAKSLEEVTGKWNGIEIPFWRESGAAQKGLDVQRALLGIDLEHAIGKYDLVVSGKSSGGEPLTCTASVIVTDGRFTTEKLQVAPQFVEPNPEQVARAQEETKRVHEIYAQVTPEKLWSGPFRAPLTGVTTGGNFGNRRVLNGEPGSPHSGVDFPAASGTPVHAAQAGRVVLAEPLYFSGNTVIVDHGLGVYTFYGHLSAFAVKAGDTVAAGALLGKAGATGRVTGPHLHWGLTVNRARVNSLDILKLL